MRFGFGQVQAVAATDIGLRRAVNEDAVLEAGTVFAVADGMGGHEAGDLASALAIATLNEIAAGAGAGVRGSADHTEWLPHAAQMLAQITTADARIRQATGARGGTTLCALALVRVEENGTTWPDPGLMEPAEPLGAQPPTTTEALHLPLPALGEPSYLPGTRESRNPAADPAADLAVEPAVDPATGDPEANPTTDVLPRTDADASRASTPGIPPAAASGSPDAPPVGAISAKITPIPGAASPTSPNPEAPNPEDQVRLMLLNVGDSRGYRLRDGALTQLTRDHSAVQELIDGGIITEDEARIHPQRNLITRALGAGGNAVPDTQFHRPRPGDRYLLCTDGLTGEVEAGSIEAILTRVPDRTEAVRRLIDAALASGGRDNISVVVVDIEAPGD